MTDTFSPSPALAAQVSRMVIRTEIANARFEGLNDACALALEMAAELNRTLTNTRRELASAPAAPELRDRERELDAQIDALLAFVRRVTSRSDALFARAGE
jgi:hypothetical protein